MEAAREIAVGADHESYLKTFYENDLLGGVRKGEEVNPRSVCTFTDERISPYRVRLGKFGPFIEYDVEGEEKPKSLSLPEDVAPADVDIDLIKKLLSQADKADAPLGTDPDQLPVRCKDVSVHIWLGDVTEEPKPKRSPLPAGVTVETVELSIALKICLYQGPGTILRMENPFEPPSALWPVRGSQSNVCIPTKPQVFSTWNCLGLWNFS